MDIFNHQKPEFSTDIESMLSLPASVFWKNCDGVYLGCNDVMAELTSVASRQVVKDIDDNELLGKDTAQQFIENDSVVLISGKTQVIDEYFRNEKGILIKGQSTKSPLFDPQGNIVGLYGISFLSEVIDGEPPEPLKLSSSIRGRYHQVRAQSLSESQEYQHKRPKLHEKLSAREIECLRWIAKGLTAKAIAEELNLSKRTVESYIEGAKSKLGCLNKTELIVAAIKYKFVDVN